MTLLSTVTAQNAANQINITPRLVLKINGHDFVFSSADIDRICRIGDPGLLIDGSWRIGGGKPFANQKPYMSLGNGTSSTLSQQLLQDRGSASSVSSMQISLIDKNGYVSQLIAPGIVLDDLLGAYCTVFLGFENTNYPEDYAKIFSGQISDILGKPGIITLTIDHPESKKRQKVFARATTKLTSGINNSVTSAPVISEIGFLPESPAENTFKSYIRIGDEIIEYTSTNTGSIDGLTRGALGTVAVSHSAGDDVESFYRFVGTPMDIALKFMLSGGPEFYADSIPVSKFGYDEQNNIHDGFGGIIYFADVDLSADYGVQPGDFFTVTDSVSNDMADIVVFGVVKQDNGSYIVIDPGIGINSELSPTTGQIAFKSMYAKYPDGLAMSPLDVDIDEHLAIQSKFLTTVQYDIYIRDTIDGKEFIEKELFLPIAAYTLPRKAKVSVGYTSDPLPGENSTVLNKANILNPSELAPRRGIAKNFFNSILYQFDEKLLEEKFITSVVNINATSAARIPVGAKTLVINSKGLRSTLGGLSIAQSAASRKLNRFAFGAEYIENVLVHFGVGYPIEIGDVVLFDSTGLNIINTKTGDRSPFQRLFEVANKSINISTGKIQLSLIDTKYSTSNRYGTVAPSSKVAAQVDAKSVLIKPSFGLKFGSDEGRKWSVGFKVKLHNANYSTVSGVLTIDKIEANKITFLENIGVTPALDWILDFATYDDCNGIQRGLYAFYSDVPFSDGSNPYVFYY